MPNWCTNHLTITTDSAAELDALMEAIEGREEMDGAPLSFARFLPVPVEMANAPDCDPRQTMRIIAGEGEPADAYTWRLRRWGTKGDAYAGEVRERTDTSVTVMFLTAWSPPIPAMVALGEKFPAQLTLIYHEQGIGFAGKLRTAAGAIIENTELEGDAAGHMLDREGLIGEWFWPEDEEDYL